MSQLKDNLTEILRQKEEFLLPENLKKDVTIFNVTGVLSASGIDTSDATAIASEIVSGKTAYVNNEKVIGTMPNNGELTYVPGDEQQIIPLGYTSGGVINAVDITTLDDYNKYLMQAITILYDNIDYTQLEYLQTDGYEYCDLGLSNENFGFDVDVAILSGTGGNLFGGVPLTGGFSYFELRNNRCKYHINSTQNKIFASTQYGIKHSYKVILTSSGYNFYYDNTFLSTISATSPGSIWMALFSFKDNENTIRADTVDTTKCRFYGMRVYDGETIVHDYIPIKLNLSNEICIYDKIEKRVFNNLGTGKFVAGPAIN